MSYKQVKYFQELEDYAAAYNVARADWLLTVKNRQITSII